MSNLQNQVVVHAGLYDQLLNEHAALRAEVTRLKVDKDLLNREYTALHEAVDNARHDSWGQAGVIEKLEARVVELEEALLRCLLEAEMECGNDDTIAEIARTALAKEGE